ncbi:MAG: Gfo/Idh/MocA family protein [Planctomycetota bacterium]|jgi:predicted dehydrogenase
MEALQVGVIGLGTFGDIHLLAYRDHPRVQVAAVCDLNEERLQGAADRYGVQACFADYTELLALDELDAVSVVTPDASHADIVVDAVRAGKAVLVEKPLATTLEDCDRIGEALRADTGPVLMAYFRLSDTIFVPTKMLSWAGASGVHWFLGSHCVDTLRWLLADEVARVHAVSGSAVLKGMGIDTPDYFLSVVEFRGGAHALIENCWVLPESSPTVVDVKLEVVGEKATFYFDPMPERLLKLTADEISTVDTYGGLEVHGRAVGFAVQSVQHFADCLLTGQQPLVGYDDGREATRVVLAIEQSANEGRPVEL